MDQTPLSCTGPLRVNLTLNVDGKTVVFDFYAITRPGEAIFSVESTSSAVVKILNYGVMDVGTTDTPTLRVVPIGQLYVGDIPDTSKQTPSAMPMDSTYPSFASFGGKLYSDIGILPFGVPEIAIAQASAGTPQGLNYLHTRDFWGPMYRNMLVEACHMKGVGSGQPDALGFSYSHHGADLLGRRAGITLNPGEGLAIVNSAETAVAVATAYGAWQPMRFAAQVDVEPQASPTLTLTGLQSGTEVRIFNAGTTTEFTGAENITGGSFSWNYDPDLVTNVDISVLSLGYQNFRLTNLALGLGSTSIPIQQVVDRQYLNP
jgi:hypothetical protein